MRSANLVIMIVVLHASAGFISAIGVADDLGVDPETGVDEKIDSTVDSARDISAANGVGETLFGLILTAWNAASAILMLVVVFPLMLSNLGVPSAILALVFAPLYIILGMDFINILLRVDLI